MSSWMKSCSSAQATVPYTLRIQDGHGESYELRAMTDLRDLLLRSRSDDISSLMTYPLLLTDNFGSKYIGTAEHACGFRDGGSPFRMEHALPDGSLDYVTSDAHVFSMFDAIFDQGKNVDVYVGIRWVKRSVTTGRVERVCLEYSNPACSMRSVATGLPTAPGDRVLIDLCFVLAV